MRISARVETCTGHRLLDYVGKCSHPHGHNYMWTAIVEGTELSGPGFIIDFSKLKRILKETVDLFDHAMVLHEKDPLVNFLRDNGNKYVTLDVNPTSENLALLVRGILRVALASTSDLTNLEMTVQETESTLVSTAGVAILRAPSIVEIAR